MINEVRVHLSKPVCECADPSIVTAFDVFDGQFYLVAYCDICHKGVRRKIKDTPLIYTWPKQ